MDEAASPSGRVASGVGQPDEAVSIQVAYYDQQIDRGTAMQTVTVSPKFQVVIPQSVREQMGLRAGARLQVLLQDDRIELIPLRSSQSLRGILRGIDTAVPREDDRE